MAIDTVLSNDSLVVVGPPASVTVNTNMGQTGDRGSIFFSGNGLPTSLNTPNSQIGDMYINRSLGGNYGTVYMNNAIPGGSAWQPIIKFQPLAYSVKKNVTFSAGSASVAIPVSDFYLNMPDSVLANDILVQVTPESSTPIFLSVSSKQFQTISSAKNLVITAVGAKFDSGSVSSLSASVNLDIFITAGSDG